MRQVHSRLRSSPVQPRDLRHTGRPNGSWQSYVYVVIAAGGHGKLRTKQGDYLLAFALP